MKTFLSNFIFFGKRSRVMLIFWIERGEIKLVLEFSVRGVLDFVMGVMEWVAFI